MYMENRLLATNESIEFEKETVEVNGFMKITHRFRGIYGIYPTLIKEDQKITCKLIGLGNTRIFIMTLS